MSTQAITGGQVYVDGEVRTADVLIQDGLISAIGEIDAAAIAAADERLDASDCIVTPGLVDTHTHLYDGAFRLGIRAERVAARSGTTTWVDAGTAGAGAFAGLLRHVRDQARIRIVPFINLSFMGLANAGLMTREVGELWDASYADVRAILRANEENPGEIKGVKLRASSNALADNAASVLPQARWIADELDVPLMIHIGMSPPTIGEIVPHLRAGDLLTHCFHPHAGGRITDRHGKLQPSVREAIDRGVALDVGHGVASMSHAVARTCLEHGVWPSSLSSDIHAENIGWPVRSQLTVLELFLALGMSLPDVLERSTRLPADLVRRTDVGRLAVGGKADVAVLRLVDDPFDKQDSTGDTVRVQQRIECVATFVDGTRLEVVDDGIEEFRTSPWLTRFGAQAPTKEETR